MRNVEIAVCLAPGATAPSRPVTLRVQIEEITAADAPARVVARTTEPGVDLAAPPQVVLAVPPPDPRARYTVRVHADVDGSGLIAPEDFVSVQSTPVLTHEGAGKEKLAVEVWPVG
ncbi:YbaY family lipoprotein [Streptomyces sp. VRA16 Mangrove soil]|uniref:YbaY family lipoprotein n=1 Tax=Streptomyces sp. VRA16 Mangrove soil TaxID=2817434 RepID=UPI001A9DA5B4|nr:YbaY family lipoprotein [Streptomyces sp. VRA16 Mangrove soil]MBO1330826.1 YbaY family lipoprotein [Streptomyces sp. VRA16 Mangrove soil]